MFSHIKEAIRTVTYRDSPDDPDIVIAERAEPAIPVAGRRISRLIEGFVIVSIVGPIAAFAGLQLDHLIPRGSVTLTTIAGTVGVFLGLAVNWLRTDIERNISSHVNLADALAPFFGHRLDETFRILKGSTRGPEAD
jgi:hypothetical protein